MKYLSYYFIGNLIGCALAFLVLLLGCSARAESISFNYGIGTFLPHDTSLATVKAFYFSKQQKINDIFRTKYDLGVWADRRGDVGRKSSIFGTYSVGARAEALLFYAECFWGIGALSGPDTMLGSWWSFNQDLSFGLIGVNDVTIGLNYKHMSNAGLASPNKGRDFFVIKAAIPF